MSIAAIILAITVAANIVFLYVQSDKRHKSRSASFAVVPFALLGIAQWQLILVISLAALSAVLVALNIVIIARASKNKKKASEETVTGEERPAPAVDNEASKDEQTARAESADERPVEEPVVPTPAPAHPEKDGAKPVATAADKPENTLKEDKPATVAEAGGEAAQARSEPKIVVRYRKSFTARLIQAPDETKRFYSQLKNHALSFADVTCRTTWNCESINLGRKQLIKFNVRGKTLQVYFAIVPEDYEGTKYKIIRSESKRYANVPCLYKIKNERRAKYASELIEETMEKSDIATIEREAEDYVLPYEPFEPLFERGLIKEIKRRAVKKSEPLPAGEELVAVPATVAEARTEETHEREQEIVESHLTDAVTVDEAHEMISDEVAAALVEHVKAARVEKYKGKAIVNIDTLSNAFAAHSVVTLSSLKEKKLVGKSVGYVKVLARGVLDKPLEVELNDFSSDAVKMILLTGGKVRRIDK